MMDAALLAEVQAQIRAGIVDAHVAMGMAPEQAAAVAALWDGVVQLEEAVDGAA